MQEGLLDRLTDALTAACLSTHRQEDNYRIPRRYKAQAMPHVGYQLADEHPIELVADTVISKPVIMEIQAVIGKSISILMTFSRVSYLNLHGTTIL